MPIRATRAVRYSMNARLNNKHVYGQVMVPSEKSNNSINEKVNLHQFRIFLASPGDVPLERKLAREAIAHISSERRFRGRINIEIIAWDQPGAAVAMEAG